MTTFPTVIDPKEMDLIDKVAKRLAPDVFTADLDSEDVSPRVRQWDQTLRREARSSAAEIIKIVRDHDASKEGA
jgi:hypothetical protein